MCRSGIMVQQMVQQPVPKRAEGRRTAADSKTLALHRVRTVNRSGCARVQESEGLRNSTATPQVAPS
jgi:hypothetical protein